jgi:hypothetical protein
MKVFISWSGERSRRVAELLHTWIECVIQAVEPWVSSSDIDRGALWFTQIIDELSTTTHGIICLTRENKEKPWILFEAGALAKGLASSRIYTLLVDLNPEDIRDPLAQFNHTRPIEGEMFKLVSSINRGLESKGLKESILRSAFATYWPQFQTAFAKIITETEETAAPKIDRPQEEILSEILNAVRGIDKRVRQVEMSSMDAIAPNERIMDERLKQSAARAAAAFQSTKAANEKKQLYAALTRTLVNASLTDEVIVSSLVNNPPFLSIQQANELIAEIRNSS